MEAVLYVDRISMFWRYLPHDFAPWETVLLRGGRNPGGRCGRELTSIEHAEGREDVPYATLRGKDGHAPVVPADAQPLLAAGRVDPRLFDVTALLSMKYGDDERRTLPLIADGAPRSSPAAARSLPALGFTAGSVAKTELGEVWKDTLADDDSRLWLDGRHKALDETSTRQIGAPHAWPKGLTGKGVTVAVLDSGADASHPDLTGAISVSKDFTGTGEGDGNGHGTMSRPPSQAVEPPTSGRRPARPWPSARSSTPQAVDLIPLSSREWSGPRCPVGPQP